MIHYRIFNMIITDKSLVHNNWAESDSSKACEKNLSKAGSNYAVVNGALVNIDAEDNDNNTVTIASANIGFPRSETIAAISRPYTGDLEPIRVLREKWIKGKGNEEDGANKEFCKKCGHYSTRQ